MEDQFIQEQIKTMFKVSKRLQLAFSDVKKLTTKYLLKVKKIKSNRERAIIQYEEKKKKQEIQMKKKAKQEERKAKKEKLRLEAEQAEQAEKQRKKIQQQQKPKHRSIISILKPQRFANIEKNQEKQDKGQKKKIKKTKKTEQKQKQKEKQMKNEKQKQRQKQRQRQRQRQRQKQKEKQKQKVVPLQGMKLVQQIKNKNREQPKKQTAPKILEKPKEPLSPYYRFLKMKKTEIWSTIGTMPATHTTKIMRTVWQKMSDAQKSPFVKQYEIEKAKYERQTFLYYNPKRGQLRKPEEKKEEEFHFDFIDQLSNM